MTLVTFGPGKFFHCGLCNFSTKNKNTIATHIETHPQVYQNKKLKLYQCKICKQEFHLKAEFDQHKQSVQQHNNNNKSTGLK